MSGVSVSQPRDRGRWLAVFAAPAVTLSFLCAGCGGQQQDTVAVVTGDVRVDALLGRMTLEQQIAMTHGAPEAADTDQGQAGYLPGVPRLGIPPLRFADGPPGVLTRHPATGLTATMGLAATFSRDDARANGVVIGRDARALGIDVVLEPYLNLHRDQAFARAYNTYGEDPLLAGQIGANVITGIQSQQVMAQAKHYIGYDGAHDVSVDPQTLHEIYLVPFADAVAAGVSSIMCSYNRINGAYACGNSQTLETVLRGDLGFKGFVTSDWGAVHDTTFINDGLDLEMPGSGTVMTSYFQARLPGRNAQLIRLSAPSGNPIPEEPIITSVTPPDTSVAPVGMLAAVHSALVPASNITRAAGRILYEMDRFGLLDGGPRRAAGPPAIDANESVVLKTGEDAATLLKNDDHALPLARADLTSLALIGPGAGQTIAVGISGEKALGHVRRQIGTVNALRSILGPGARIVYAPADDMTGVPIPAANLSHGRQPGLLRTNARDRTTRVDSQLDFTLANQAALPPGASVSWSGTLKIPASGRYRLYLQVLGAAGSVTLDGKPLADTGSLQLHGNVLQPGQDNVLPTTDGLDDVRRELSLSAGLHTLDVRVTGDGSEAPVQARLNWVTPEQQRADVQAAVIAARHAHKAVVFAWSRGQPVFHLPGNQDALIEAVAAVNPNTVVVLNVSEPIAMPWLDKVRAVLLMWYPGDEGGMATARVLLGKVNPGGHLPITWPRRLAQNVANDPAHPERSSAGVNGRTTYSEGIYMGYRWFDHRHIDPLFPFGYGLSYTRFDYSNLTIGRGADGGFDVSFGLRNSGDVAGDAVPQVYLGPPDPLPANVQFAERALVAFDRVHLDPGESRAIKLHVPVRALQYWSVVQSGWQALPSTRTVYVGNSSRDARLNITENLGGP